MSISHVKPILHFAHDHEHAAQHFQPLERQFCFNGAGNFALSEGHGRQQ